jgi:DNA-directed RNA polymerase specialized sigma24 family protein
LALLNAVRRGEPGALNRFVTHLAPGLARVLRQRLRGRVTVDLWWEDVLQEALFRIARDVRTCRATTGAACWGWAIAVAWHAAVDALDAPSAAASLLRSAVLLGPAMEDSLAWRELQALTTADAEADPHTRLAHLVVEAQNALSEDAAAILWLRLVQGATWEDAAAAVGVPPAAAKRRFQRAQASLRREVLAAIQRLPAPERAALEIALRAYRPVDRRE